MKKPQTHGAKRAHRAPVKKKRATVKHAKQKAKRRKTPAGALGDASNLSAAASITGLSRQVLSEAKDAGCRGFRTNGSVDCDAVVEFVAARPDLLEAAEANVNYDFEKALRQRALRKMAEDKLAVSRGKLISREEAAAQIFAAFSAAKNALIGNRPTIAQRIAVATGGDVSVIDELLDAHHQEFLESLHAGEWNPKCPKCGS